MRETDGRFDDRPAREVEAHVADEGLVDLHRVDRQLLQVRERGVAGTEVIDRQRDAHVAQPGEALERALGIDHEHALRDLEAQP